jgi:hypothetical protein
MKKYNIELLDGDFFDSEKEVFEITYNGMDSFFAIKAMIKDHDGVEWNCYLVKVVYYKKTDCYVAYYKPY